MKVSHCLFVIFIQPESNNVFILYLIVQGVYEMCSQPQCDLVYALWQEIPKLVYAFWTLQPVNRYMNFLCIADVVIKIIFFSFQNGEERCNHEWGYHEAPQTRQIPLNIRT